MGCAATSWGELQPNTMAPPALQVDGLGAAMKGHWCGWDYTMCVCGDCLQCEASYGWALHRGHAAQAVSSRDKGRQQPALMRGKPDGALGSAYSAAK